MEFISAIAHCMAFCLYFGQAFFRYLYLVSGFHASNVRNSVLHIEEQNVFHAKGCLFPLRCCLIFLSISMAHQLDVWFSPPLQLYSCVTAMKHLMRAA